MDISFHFIHDWMLMEELSREAETISPIDGLIVAASRLINL